MILQLILTPFVFAANAITIRLFQVRFQNTPAALTFFQSALCLVSAVGNAALIRELPDLCTLLGAAAFGVLFFVACFGSARCYQSGPMSVTSVVMNSSLLIPILWSVAVWNDALSPLQIIGIAVLILMFILSATGGEAKKPSRLWLILLIFAFFSNGGTAVLQKYQKQRTDAQDAAYLAVAYFTAAVFFFVYSLIVRRKEEKKPLVRKKSALIPLLALISGLGSFAGNALLQSLCTQVPAGILYPVVNGGLCIVTALTSFLVFREKVTRRKIAALISGVAGIVILNL